MSDKASLEFLDLSEAALQEWRDHSVSRLFLRDLQRRKRSAEVMTVQAALHGMSAVATSNAGAATALTSIIDDCTQSRAPTDDDPKETPFHDPRKRKGT